VSVIEWAERLGDRSWKLEVGKIRKVKIEIAGEAEREIIYDDFGA
jgi:hypothetical protein